MSITPGTAPAAPSLFEDYTVTQVDPLRIQRTGSPNELPFTPDTLVDASMLEVDDRVRVEHAGGRVIVAGRAGGLPASTPEAVVATADTLALRDGSGRTQFADPSADADADTKGARDAAIAVERALPVQGQVPSQVDVGSGSASVAADGTVTLSAVSWVRLRDVFDGLGVGFYRLHVSVDGTTNSSQYIRLSSAGTDLSSGYNRVGQYTIYAAGPTRVASFPINFLTTPWPNITTFAPIVDAEVAIWTPENAARYTQALTQSVVAASNRALWLEYGQAPVGAYDGLAYIASAGTMTGKLKVVKIA